jgi:hypothetical protein
VTGAGEVDRRVRFAERGSTGRSLPREFEPPPKAASKRAAFLRSERSLLVVPNGEARCDAL